MFSSQLIVEGPYDDVGRLRTVVNPAGKKITYAYDAVGQRRFMMEPGGGRFTYAFDDAGRIRYQLNPQNDRSSYAYDSASRRESTRLANGTRASFGYDDANRLLKLANIKDSDGSTISSFDYAYDAVGNRTRVVESSGDRVTWSYDNLYQLTRERRSGSNSYDITYSYDAAGNRRTKLENAIRTTYACDAANQLLTLKDNTGTTTYTFDANGNQRTTKVPAGGVSTNTWDYENRLTKLILPTAVRSTFSYNADGQRVQEAGASGTSKLVWDLQNTLLETDSGDVSQVIYTLEPVTYGNLISQFRNGATSFFHFDALGSTDRLTNNVGSVTDNYLYKAFGILVLSSGTTGNSYRYIGREGYRYDGHIAQYHLRSRDYDPTSARFQSRDLARMMPKVPGHAHRYAYARNNPLRYVDPSGKLERFPLPEPAPSLLESCLVRLGVRIGFGELLAFCAMEEVSPKMKEFGKRTAERLVRRTRPKCETQFPNLDPCINFPESGDPEDALDRCWPGGNAELGPESPGDQCKSEGGSHYNVYRQGRVDEEAHFLGSILCCPCCVEAADPYESFGCRCRKVSD